MLKLKLQCFGHLMRRIDSLEKTLMLGGIGGRRRRGRQPFQTTQGNRLSCRDQEGRRGSEEAVPGLSVFFSGDPGVSGDFWGSQEGCQGPFRHSGRNRGLPLRRPRGQGPHLAKRCSVTASQQSPGWTRSPVCPMLLSLSLSTGIFLMCDGSIGGCVYFLSAVASSRITIGEFFKMHLAIERRCA